MENGEWREGRGGVRVTEVSGVIGQGKKVIHKKQFTI